MTPAPQKRGPRPDKGNLPAHGGPSRTPSSLPHDSQDLPAVAPSVDRGQMRHFVSQIKSAEQQIGEHIISALQEEDTVAVLTAVVVDPSGGQRIVSAALDPEMLQQVQVILQKAEQQRAEEVPCVGFHCLLRPRGQGERTGDAST